MAQDHSGFQELEDGDELFPEPEPLQEQSSNGPRQSSMFVEDPDDLFAGKTFRNAVVLHVKDAKEKMWN